MLLRGLPRSFYTKLFALAFVITCILFYVKFMLTSSSNRPSAADYGQLDDENAELNRIAAQQLLAKAAAVKGNGGGRAVAKAGGKLSIVDADIEDRIMEKLIRLDMAKQVKKLGDRGKAVSLVGKAKEIGEKRLSVIALNEELSEHLSYNRTTPDARNPLCKLIKYDVNSLPTASVVVIFYNEPYSVLVRTVHSVINTCPGHMLKEVILVDDCSTNVELKDKLDYYIRTRLDVDRVKTIRLKNRLVFISFLCRTLSNYNGGGEVKLCPINNFVPYLHIIIARKNEDN